MKPDATAPVDYIDFRAIPGHAHGAVVDECGFRTNRPWGRFDLGLITLRQGWYTFTVEGEGAILSLYDCSTHNLIELPAREGEPTHIRLTGGDYEIALIPGARPGVHEVAVSRLEPLGRVRQYILFASRLADALGHKLSFGRIFRLGRQLFSKENFGLRSRLTSDSGTIGVLTRADLARDLSNAALGDYASRLAKLQLFPSILIQTQEGRPPSIEAVGEQVYPHYTLDPAAHSDYIFELGEDEHLTPDALLLAVEHMEAYPAHSILLADKWIDGKPTTRVAWDPVLYWEQLPTPFMRKKGEPAQIHFGNRAEFGIVPVPIAYGIRPESYSAYPVEASADRPACSIIIPTRDRADLLRNCLDGLFERTDWPHEVIVVDNGSVESETHELFAEYDLKGLRVIRSDAPFNFSALCNLGVKAAQYDYVVLLNNDVQVSSPDWLSSMMAFAVMPWAGAVGTRLLYADGRLQHGGVIMGLSQICGHLWRGLDPTEQNAKPQLAQPSLRRAVTAACMCVAASKYWHVGGMDEQNFPVTLNDVDFCLKLEQNGWFNLYLPRPVSIHLESETRGFDESEARRSRRLSEMHAFAKRWPDSCTDPWLSPAISVAGESGKLR